MDDYLALIIKLLIIHLALTFILISYSFFLLKKSNGKAGMTPESPQAGVAIIAMTLASMLAVSLDDNNTLQFGLSCIFLFFRTFYYLAIHIKHYFVFKSKIRSARILYKQTGQKSDLTVPGYTSLNTLMLTVLVHIFGLFVYGTVMYYSFIGFSKYEAPIDSGYTDYEL